jgi:effector-binding domain-containing protein
MAKGVVVSIWEEHEVLQKKYDQLLKEHEELKKTVTCDYYESYLLEKAKKEKLEKQINETVPGYEYYSHD